MFDRVVGGVKGAGVGAVVGGVVGGPIGAFIGASIGGAVGSEPPEEEVTCKCPHCGHVYRYTKSLYYDKISGVSVPCGQCGNLIKFG